MTYQHDVFLSYSRSNQWPQYVEKKFLPMFRHFLDEAIEDAGPPARIYVDVEQIETGQAWPAHIAGALAASKVLLALWSANYSKSPWCRAELTHMLARRKAVASGDEPLPALVLVAVVGDGSNIEQKLPDIQVYKMQQYSNPWLASGTKTEMRLANVIEKLAEHAASALKQAPAYDPQWKGLAQGEVHAVFDQQAEQIQPPSLGWARI
jgi:hypothetical protein